MIVLAKGLVIARPSVHTGLLINTDFRRNTEFSGLSVTFPTVSL